MKKLITLALIATIGLSAYAQDKKMGCHTGQMEKFTPEQRNELMLKKMTLDLDLNATQQKEIGKMIAGQSAKREASMKNRKDKTEKPTSEEMFAMKSKMLDEQIAMKEQMKKILSPEQFKKWDEMKTQRHEGMKKRGPVNMHKDMHKEAQPKE